MQLTVGHIRQRNLNWNRFKFMPPLLDPATQTSRLSAGWEQSSVSGPAQ